MVHHDAVTHTEQVLVQDAWDETVTTGYRCTGCGTVFASEAECTQHIANAAASSSGATSSASSSGSASSGGTSSGSTSAGSPCAGAQCQPVTEVVHHEAVYQDQVVVDKEAWDETVLTGYVCSGCGATKGPNDP